MLVDTQLELSDAQALTATAISSNVIDLQSASGGGTNIASAIGGTANSTMDIGQGEDVYLVVRSVTAAAGGDSAKTLTITLETATDAGLTTGAVVHFSTTAITGAAITAGADLAVIKLPLADYKRYLGLRYTVSASFTSFTIDAFLTKDVQRAKIYRSGYTVQ